MDRTAAVVMTQHAVQTGVAVGLDGVGAAADVELAVHAQLVGQLLGVVLALGVGVLAAPAELADLYPQAVRRRQALLGQLLLHLVEQVLQLLLILLPFVVVAGVAVGLGRHVNGLLPDGAHDPVALLAAAVRPVQVAELLGSLDCLLSRLLADLFGRAALRAL